MRKYWITFKNKALEKEYCAMKEQAKAEPLQMILVFWIVLFIQAVIITLVQQIYIGTAIFSGFLVYLLIIFVLRKRLKKWTEYIVILTSIVLNFLLFLTYLGSQTPCNPGDMFVRGFSFGVIQFIVLNQFSQLKYKIAFILFSYAIVFGILGAFSKNSVPAEIYVQNFLYDLFIVYISFYYEKKERLIFKNCYEYREELTKFKELIANFPQGISVISQKTHAPLFTNKALLGVIGLDVIEQAGREEDIIEANERSPGILLDSKQESRSILEKFIVQQDTLRQVGASQPCTTLAYDQVNLMEFIQKLIEEKILSYKPLCLSVSFIGQNREKTFEATLTPLSWDAEEGIAIIFNDTTHRNNLIALRDTDEYKDRAIATVSHELRTPLNGIIGILQLAQKQCKQAEIHEYISLCKDNAGILVSLVNSLLDLQQIHLGIIRLNPSKVNIRTFCQETLRLFHFQSTEKNLYLDLKVDQDVPTHINTDPDRVRQILTNLIGNALKFTSKGGITIHVAQDPEESGNIEISVSDTGIGIKDEDRDRLIKRYGRLDDREGMNKKGVGLGLTISDTLAKVLSENIEGEGLIWHSIYGIGTTFSFRISKNLGKSPNSSSKEINIIYGPSKEEISGDQETGPKKEEEERTIRINNQALIGQKGSSEDLVKEGASLNIESKLSRYLTARNVSLQNLLHSEASKSILTRENLVTEDAKSLRKDLEIRMFEKRENFESPSFAESISLNPLRQQNYVLIADDYAFNLLIARKIVEELGYNAETCMNGEEALRKVKARSDREEPYKLILMDCQMPVMDGFETTKILKGMMDRKEISSVPIIALTAHQEGEEIRRCFESGMVDYLSKPLLIDSLSKVMAKILNRSKELEEV